MSPLNDLNGDRKGVCPKGILLLLLLLFLAAAYLAWYHYTGIGIPCIFRLITGLQCPGCGITTMFTALFFLDFHSAYEANQYLFVTLPFLIFESVFELIRRKLHKPCPLWNQILLILYLVGLITFGILRALSEPHTHGLAAKLFAP